MASSTGCRSCRWRSRQAPRAPTGGAAGGVVTEGASGVGRLGARRAAVGAGVRIGVHGRTAWVWSGRRAAFAWVVGAQVAVGAAAQCSGVIAPRVIPGSERAAGVAPRREFEAAVLMRHYACPVSRVSRRFDRVGEEIIDVDGEGGGARENDALRAHRAPHLDDADQLGAARCERRNLHPRAARAAGVVDALAVQAAEELSPLLAG